MLPNSVARQLSAPANLAITNALTHGALQQSGPPANEVAYVAALVLGGVPGIAAAWKPILSQHNYTLSITGVFCHAAPQVTFGSKSPPSRCELADLLLIVDEVSNGTVLDRRAVLVQAKMDRTGNVTPSGTELTQLALYSGWPRFTFVPTVFQPPSRDFSKSPIAGTPHDCGSYGLINGRSSPRQWQQSPPASTMTGQVDLGTFLAEMADATISGSGCRALAGGCDDWSKTVDDLLRITAALPLVHASLQPAPGGAPGPVRGVTAAALLSNLHPAQSTVYYVEGAPPDGGGGEDGRGRREGNGVSTIRIMFSGQ